MAKEKLGNLQEIKVLIVSPSFTLKGGVVEFNKMLLKNSEVSFILFEQLSGLATNHLKLVCFLLLDYLHYVFILLFNPVDIVHINPSLGNNSLKRDGLYTWIAKKFRKKVFVHWHGWNPRNEHLLNTNFVKRTIFKADHIKFLSSNFEKKFRDSGFLNKTSIGNTFIDDELIVESYSVSDNKTIKILFLSNISKNKGIYVALEAFANIISQYPDLHLIVAGTGDELINVKKFVQENKIQNVDFRGFVTGKEKEKVFHEADIYLFPSYYEGMPTSVIEAMAFGLPVVTSKVGALPDFFIPGEMGFFVESNLPVDFSRYLEKLILNNKMRSSMAQRNKQFALEKFLASKTVAKIDLDYLWLFNHLPENQN